MTERALNKRKDWETTNDSFKQVFESFRPPLRFTGILWWAGKHSMKWSYITCEDPDGKMVRSRAKKRKKKEEEMDCGREKEMENKRLLRQRKAGAKMARMRQWINWRAAPRFCAMHQRNWWMHLANHARCQPMLADSSMLSSKYDHFWHQETKM